MTATYDAYDAAMTAPPPPSLERTVFGEVAIVDPWFCVLQKGAGKVPFDGTIHDESQKRVSIKLGVACEGKDGTPYSVDQDVINASKEWREFTLPSLQAIGKDLRTLAGCFVQVKRKPTGERYQHKTSGEWRDKTALVFVAVYPDKDAMQAAADQFYTSVRATAAPTADQFAAAQASVVKPGVTSQPAPAAPAATIDRATAAGFLPMMWMAAGQDKAKFYSMVIANPMLADFHNASAPEMVTYLGERYDPGLGDNLPF